jgi:hypothetical protein
VKELRPLLKHTTSPGGFMIKSVAAGGRTVLVIAGNDPAATLHAAYRYAEHLGVGFGLEGDAVPDRRIDVTISGLDEAGVPLFETRGIQPFHDFYEGPDFWNTDDYLTVISQLTKLGMNFIGLHTYPQYSTTEEKARDERQGPEPTVWIGLPKDVHPDGTVAWAYPTTYAHTHRPGRMWGFAVRDTDKFHAGASQLFDRNQYGSSVMGDVMPENRAGFIEVFNRTGKMLNVAFTHARRLGVKTALGTELPLGLEPKGPEVGRDWVRGMPTDLQKRLADMKLDPKDPAVVRKVYTGIFQRIMKTHPLDYYWLWSWEVWSRHGVNRAQIKAFRKDILLAHEAMKEVKAPFQLALAGWILGTDDDPAVFDDLLPPEAPFFGLWDQAQGFDELKASRVKWPATWLEEDWGLAQPQLELHRIYNDTRAALREKCHGLIAKHWRTRIVGANIGSMKDLLWVYGPTGAPVKKAVPRDRDAWIDAYYRDWAARQFGPEAAAPIAAIFAGLDKAGEGGPGAVPHVLEWDGGPGAIVPNEEPWSRVRKKYAFIAKLEKLRSRIVGAGNLERFDYWLNAFRCLKLMGLYGRLRHQFEEAAEEEEWKTALELRKEMARLWEDLMTLEIRKAYDAADLGEIVNLEILNWYQLMKREWDAKLKEGLRAPLPPDADPYMDYKGSPFVRVSPVRTQVGEGEALCIRARIMGEPASAVLRYRPLGGGDYKEIALTCKGRAVHEASLPAQPDDFEYYIEAATLAGDVRFPVTAPSINQTVIVVPSD